MQQNALVGRFRGKYLQNVFTYDFWLPLH